MIGRGHQDIFAGDVAWMDGQEPGIAYARFRLTEDDPHSPTVILSKFEPGVRVPPHTHDTDYFEYIIDGVQTVGKTMFGKGDVRLVTSGTGYGPIVVGPEGCTVLIVFADGSRSVTVPMPRQAAAVEA
jgi:anti-sigma factor ChrR (cupin superfamily)